MKKQVLLFVIFTCCLTGYAKPMMGSAWGKVTDMLGWVTGATAAQKEAKATAETRALRGTGTHLTRPIEQATDIVRKNGVSSSDIVLSLRAALFNVQKLMQAANEADATSRVALRRQALKALGCMERLLALAARRHRIDFNNILPEAEWIEYSKAVAALSGDKSPLEPNRRGSQRSQETRALVGSRERDPSPEQSFSEQMKASMDEFFGGSKAFTLKEERVLLQTSSASGQVLISSKGHADVASQLVPAGHDKLFIRTVTKGMADRGIGDMTKYYAAQIVPGGIEAEHIVSDEQAQRLIRQNQALSRENNGDAWAGLTEYDAFIQAGLLSREQIPVAATAGAGAGQGSVATVQPSPFPPAPLLPPPSIPTATPQAGTPTPTPLHPAPAGPPTQCAVSPAQLSPPAVTRPRTPPPLEPRQDGVADYFKQHGIQLAPEFAREHGLELSAQVAKTNGGMLVIKSGDRYHMYDKQHNTIKPMGTVNGLLDLFNQSGFVLAGDEKHLDAQVIAGIEAQAAQWAAQAEQAAQERQASLAQVFSPSPAAAQAAAAPVASLPVTQRVPRSRGVVLGRWRSRARKNLSYKDKQFEDAFNDAQLITGPLAVQTVKGNEIRVVPADQQARVLPLSTKRVLVKNKRGVIHEVYKDRNGDMRCVSSYDQTGMLNSGIYNGFVQGYNASREQGVSWQAVDRALLHCINLERTYDRKIVPKTQPPIIASGQSFYNKKYSGPAYILSAAVPLKEQAGADTVSVAGSDDGEAGERPEITIFNPKEYERKTKFYELPEYERQLPLIGNARRVLELRMRGIDDPQEARDNRGHEFWKPAMQSALRMLLVERYKDISASRHIDSPHVRAHKRRTVATVDRLLKLAQKHDGISSTDLLSDQHWSTYREAVDVLGTDPLPPMTVEMSFDEISRDADLTGAMQGVVDVMSTYAPRSCDVTQAFRPALLNLRRLVEASSGQEECLQAERRLGLMHRLLSIAKERHRIKREHILTADEQRAYDKAVSQLDKRLVSSLLPGSVTPVPPRKPAGKSGSPVGKRSAVPKSARPALPVFGPPQKPVPVFGPHVQPAVTAHAQARGHGGPAVTAAVAVNNDGAGSDHVQGADALEHKVPMVSTPRAIGLSVLIAAAAGMLGVSVYDAVQLITQAVRKKDRKGRTVRAVLLSIFGAIGLGAAVLAIDRNAHLVSS